MEDSQCHETTNVKNDKCHCDLIIENYFEH